jgi:hypothetical protein
MERGKKWEVDLSLTAETRGDGFGDDEGWLYAKTFASQVCGLSSFIYSVIGSLNPSSAFLTFTRHNNAGVGVQGDRRGHAGAATTVEA